MSKECIPLYYSYNTMTEISFVNSAGVFPQTKEFDQTKKFGGFAIGKFKKHGNLVGTGFIIKLCRSTYPIVGLLLTAAHIFVEMFEYKPEPLEFIIGQESYEAIPLKNSLDWSNPSARYLDPITNCPISIPEDWVVCELRQIPDYNYSSILVSLNIADPSQTISSGLQTRLIGFPKKIEKDNIRYTSPEANSSQYSEIIQCFLECKKLIISKGEVLNALDMICITCVSANGMTGSPLLIKEHGKYKVIGLLHGGPASPIHYHISQLLSDISNPSQFDFDALISYIGFKRSLAVSTEAQQCLETCHDILILLRQMAINSRKIHMAIADLLRQYYPQALYMEFITGNKLKYNLCMPIHKIHYELSGFISRYA
ncbi:hypothetical protein SteCoe_35490 [Stentor coeruleus]|uniref:Peptidase S1 domain-containing protein n=1 Tax=Stentor coeruleus TaxID=5963 RepID=A0A1R2ASJ2_9CILI|nr:hypothetical protein SteCoe_35490 [Stentor coeruleus]